MATFWGSVLGNRGEASRLGSRGSGLRTVAASWEGAVSVKLFLYIDGDVGARVELIPWRGRGVSRVLYNGRVSGVEDTAGGRVPMQEAVGDVVEFLRHISATEEARVLDIMDQASEAWQDEIATLREYVGGAAGSGVPA